VSQPNPERSERFEITAARTDGTTEVWHAELDVMSPHREYRLGARTPDGQEWEATSSDVFGCLRAVRAQIEPLGWRLCVNGSRRDVWASGMLADMGEGRGVYHLSADVPQGQRHPILGTLDPIAPELAVTLDEQQAWYASWLQKPRSRSPKQRKW
jgi:hypothetical protein